MRQLLMAVINPVSGQGKAAKWFSKYIELALNAAYFDVHSLRKNSIDS